MNMIKKISLATTLGLFAILTSVSSIAAGAPDISGTYMCTGYDPTYASSPHFTETLVLNKVRDVYRVQILNNQSTVPNFIGTAIFNNDVNDAISIIYWSIKRPSSPANEFFTIKPDGSLEGIYLDTGEPKPDTISCTKS
jgi:hypothetical protein